MKKPYLFILLLTGLLIVSCAPKEHMADCNGTSGSYICFNNEGRDAIYTRWNFDSVQTYNAFNIQGSYPGVPGTQGPWTTINITLVTSTGNFAMETGLYTYAQFLTNSGEKRFNFWLKRYEGDAKNPDVKNFIKDPGGVASLNISSVSGTGKLSGIFVADVINMNNTSEKGYVRFFFSDVNLQ